MDRLEQLKRQGIRARLVKGAAYLGSVWRDGHRCKSGWAGVCNCGQDASAFCRGKIRWMGLLLEYHGGWPYELTGTEEYAVIEAMTVKQFEASGLTAHVELPGAGAPIKIGEHGTQWTTIVDLAIIPPGEDRDAAIAAVQKIQAVFV